MQDEEITEDDLRLIQERESSIRQLEVSLTWQLEGHSVLRVFVLKMLRRAGGGA